MMPSEGISGTVSGTAHVQYDVPRMLATLAADLLDQRPDLITDI